MRSSPPPPGQSSPERGLPQQVWNQHGLTLLILLALIPFAKALCTVIIVLLSGKEAFLKWLYSIDEISALLIVKRGANPNVPIAIDQLKQIISDAFNLSLIHELAFLTIISYWLLTLMRLLKRRRRGMADSTTLFLRPTFAFSLLLPIDWPIRSYLGWTLFNRRLSDPLVLDYANIMWGLPQPGMVNLASVGGMVDLALTVGIAWPLSLVAMRWLGGQAHRFGFR